MPDTQNLLRHADAAALDTLDRQWGDTYDIAGIRAGWVAKRLDNNRALVAASAGELRKLIVADDEAQPISHHGAGS
jgi:hypothetical protein